MYKTRGKKKKKNGIKLKNLYKRRGKEKKQRKKKKKMYKKNKTMMKEEEEEEGEKLKRKEYCAVCTVYTDMGLIYSKVDQSKFPSSLFFKLQS
ncbi:hypothetical protein M8J77_007264 [Diaphorina citri]|nr:hypothetical protein M8J77_007264 [Diaphorina citri]